MGWGDALAAGVNGWMRGADYVKQNERDEEDLQWKKDQRARVKKEQAEADKLQADLKAAAAPVAMTEGAGGMVKPDTMDNRDVGLPENAALPNGGLQQDGYAVAGQAFSDKDAAQAALTKANAPQAVNQRVAAAYRQNGQIDKALSVENADRTAESQKMQLADQVWKRDLGNAMRGGHDGLAALATQSEAGPMKGLNVKAVPSADGKTVTYSAVAADGSISPIPGLPSFSNDQNGLIQAAYLLDHTVDPAARMAHADQQAERERQQKNADRAFDQQASQFSQTFGLQSRTAERQDKLADTQIAAADLALKEAQQNAKVPAAVKMTVESYKKEADTIASAIAKAQADNTWDPTSPNAKALLERQAVISAKVQKALQPYMTEAVGTDPFKLRPQGKNAGANGGKGGGAGRGMAAVSYKDPVWDGAESNASKTTGVPTEVLKTIRTVGERSNGDQVSPAGAKGVYQFTQKTRDRFLEKYGVDAYSDNHDEQALAAAYHLKESYDRTGSWDKAMAGYNGGTSAEKGTNKTAENRDYAARTSAALAAADPMEAVYKKQVAELNRGTRTELSPDVSAWRKRKDDTAAKEGQQRFNAAQATYLQNEKLKAQRASREMAAVSRAS